MDSPTLVKIYGVVGAALFSFSFNLFWLERTGASIIKQIVPHAKTPSAILIGVVAIPLVSYFLLMIVQRGGGARWRADRPYHVALEDRYIREHWDEIDALCKLNSLPFNATGEVIEDVGVWRVYEFTWQMDAILFWDRFEARWLRGTEFHYPERPENLPSLKPLQNWFNPRNLR